jgi:hypothetical protein
MITPSERVHDLVQRGALPPEQGEALLSALKAEPPRWSRVLFNPLHRFGGERLVAVGLAAVLLGALLRRFGVVFDGFLDTHYAATQPRWALALAEAVVAWPFGALVLWVASLVAARQGRFIDFLGLVGVARVPVVLLGVVMAVVAPLSPPAFTPDHPPVLTGRLIAIAVVGAMTLTWQLVLLYRGFGTGSGLRGARRVVAFVAGVLVAELVSKFGLSILM